MVRQTSWLVFAVVCSALVACKGKDATTAGPGSATTTTSALPPDAGAAPQPVGPLTWAVEATFADGSSTTLAQEGDNVVVQPVSQITVSATPPLADFRMHVDDDKGASVTSSDHASSDGKTLKYRLGFATPLAGGKAYTLVVDTLKGELVDIHGGKHPALRLPFQVKAAEKPKKPAK